jgi:outer membrane protein assembly factor BamA
MPWISDTFRERYLDNPESRNAILRYNYENLFIVKWGYSFFYSSQSLNSTSKNYGTNAYIIRASIETAGNLLYGISSASKASKNEDGQYTLFKNAYAQYVKGDFDFSKSFLINKTNSLALHFGLGIAYPYGNSSILPYEKRYFSGGANSVRGWSVRELGPGTFLGNDGKIDFINQTGDLKLDMNIEYRTHLFWKFDAAVFIDAGNIWTLRDYEDQPGGQFRFDTFWRQIAVAYGLGLRLNFNYFILRLDGGMKAINPAYEDSRRHSPIIHPNFKRDFSFHFAVGLPF